MLKIVLEQNRRGWHGFIYYRDNLIARTQTPRKTPFLAFRWAKKEYDEIQKRYEWFDQIIDEEIEKTERGLRPWKKC